MGNKIPKGYRVYQESKTDHLHIRVRVSDGERKDIDLKRNGEQEVCGLPEYMSDAIGSVEFDTKSWLSMEAREEDPAIECQVQIGFDYYVKDDDNSERVCALIKYDAKFRCTVPVK